VIRKATEADRVSVLEFLSREPEFNLFAIGDLLHFGIETDFQEFFLETDSAVGLKGILLRYRTSLLPWSPDPEEELAETTGRINEYLEHPGKWIILGKAEVVTRLEPRLVRQPGNQQKTEYFSRCCALRPESRPSQLHLVQRAGIDDIEEVSDLLVAIPEFKGSPHDPGVYQEEVASGIRQVAFIRDPACGRVVSTAAITCETDRSAMMIGVATLPDPRFRRKGYASACVYALTEDLSHRGKTCCLFYDNPAAGSIYKRLGYEEMGLWRMVELP